MRLGDLDALIEKIYDDKKHIPLYAPFKMCTADRVDLKHLLEREPTIDAVPVVRCKDCKYRSGLMGRPPFMFYTCTCAEGLTGAVRDENFCSYGERKDGDTDGQSLV